MCDAIKTCSHKAVHNRLFTMYFSKSVKNSILEKHPLKQDLNNVVAKPYRSYHSVYQVRINIYLIKMIIYDIPSQTICTLQG